MMERRFLWYDDRVLDGLTPILRQERNLQRTVYLYSNVIDRPALFTVPHQPELPPLPLAPSSFEVQEKSQVTVQRIKSTELSACKDAYLSKDIRHAQGDWAFAVYVDGWVAGFFEFSMPKTYAPPDTLYMMADFPVAGTRYKRLAKLIVMLAVAGETREMMERIREYHVREVTTTAFTDRPVSMKYRGVLKLAKRGETDDGRKFLNYGQQFNEKSWSEVLAEWRTKHSRHVHS
jgi:hypothetical protein